MYPNAPISSVQATTQNGEKTNFNGSSANLIILNGTCFPIKQQGRLYYPYKNSVNDICSETLEMWHKVLGHCNFANVKKLEVVVQGIITPDSFKFDCKTFILTLSKYMSGINSQ